MYSSGLIFLIFRFTLYKCSTCKLLASLFFYFVCLWFLFLLSVKFFLAGCELVPPCVQSFVPNMIGGASQADLAVLVISARKGEFETGFERGGQVPFTIPLKGQINKSFWLQ